MERNHNVILGIDNLPEYISVISASMCARIRIDDIEVIEQEGRKLHIITGEREYCMYMNISEIIRLLAGRAFYRPIRGLIINFDHVRDISGNMISFNSGQCVTMGKNSISKTRAAYKKYLLKYPPYSLWDREEHMAASVADGPLHIENSGFSDQKNSQKYVKNNKEKITKTC